MPKRFTDSAKWDDPWFFELNNNDKLLWIYILDKCNYAGIYKVNLKMLNFCLISNYDFETIKEILKKRIIVIDSERIFIKKFINFQYGELKESCHPHRAVILELKKFRVLKGYSKGKNTLQDKDKDKDKGQDKVQDKEKHMDSVFLTKEEHLKLIKKFGEEKTQEWIENLDNYIGSKGKRYKSHYKTILVWSAKAGKTTGGDSLLQEEAEECSKNSRNFCSLSQGIENKFCKVCARYEERKRQYEQYKKGKEV